jgi:hypothetical protein
VFICKICQRNFDSARGLSNHIVGNTFNRAKRNTKTSHGISTKIYFDEFYKKQGDGICKICGKETRFKGLTKGYDDYCSKKCCDKALKTINKINHADFKTTEKEINGITYRVKNCWIEKFGTEKAIEKEVCRLKKEYATKMENGTLKSKYYISSEENLCYEFLCSIFDKKEIQRQVKFKRWNLDFYIEKYNLYIEYNGKFFHGLNSSEDELKRLSLENFMHKKIYRKFKDDKSKIAYFNACKIDLIMINDINFENYRQIIENSLNCWKPEMVISSQVYQ